MQLNPNIKPMTQKQVEFTCTQILEGYNPDGEHLEAFIKYFLPPADTRSDDSIRWVAQAVGINDSRNYLNYLYSDGKFINACDGERAHRAQTNLPPGYYHPKSLEVVLLNELYPDTNKLFPSIKDRFATASIRFLEHRKRDVLEVNVGGLWVKKTHAIQAFDTFDVGLSGGLEPYNMVRGHHKLGDFVIMPATQQNGDLL